MLEKVECIRTADADRYDDCRAVTMLRTVHGEEFSRTEAYAQSRAIPGYLYVSTDDGLVELQPAEKEGVRYVRCLDEDSEEDPLLDLEKCPGGTFLPRGARAAAEAAETAETAEAQAG